MIWMWLFGWVPVALGLGGMLRWHDDRTTKRVAEEERITPRTYLAPTRVELTAPWPTRQSPTDLAAAYDLTGTLPLIVGTAICCTGRHCVNHRPGPPCWCGDPEPHTGHEEAQRKTQIIHRIWPRGGDRVAPLFDVEVDVPDTIPAYVEGIHIGGRELVGVT